MSNNNFFHELFFFSVFLILLLTLLINFLDSSVISVGSFTSKLFFNVRPSLERLPILFEVWITNNIGLLPMLFMVDFFGEVEVRFLFMILGLERVYWTFLTRCIHQFHFIVLCPNLNVLLVLIQTLAPRSLIITFLKCPIELISWMIRKFRKLSPMHTKHLLAKFSRHIFNHLLGSPFL